VASDSGSLVAVAPEQLQLVLPVQMVGGAAHAGKGIVPEARAAGAAGFRDLICKDIASGPDTSSAVSGHKADQISHHYDLDDGTQLLVSITLDCQQASVLLALVLLGQRAFGYDNESSAERGSRVPCSIRLERSGLPFPSTLTPPLTQADTLLALQAQYEAMFADHGGDAAAGAAWGDRGVTGPVAGQRLLRVPPHVQWQVLPDAHAARGRDISGT
jgi:hypothetical protein